MQYNLLKFKFKDFVQPKISCTHLSFGWQQHEEWRYYFHFNMAVGQARLHSSEAGFRKKRRGVQKTQFFVLRV